MSEGNWQPRSPGRDDFSPSNEAPDEICSKKGEVVNFTERKLLLHLASSHSGTLPSHKARSPYHLLSGHWDFKEILWFNSELQHLATKHWVLQWTQNQKPSRTLVAVVTVGSSIMFSPNLRYRLVGRNYQQMIPRSPQVSVITTSIPSLSLGSIKFDYWFPSLKETEKFKIQP